MDSKKTKQSIRVQMEMDRIQFLYTCSASANYSHLLCFILLLSIMSEMVCRCALTRFTTVRKWPTLLLVSSLEPALFVSIYSVNLLTCSLNWQIQIFQRSWVNTLHSRCFLRAQIFMESKEKTSRSRKLLASHLLSTRSTIQDMIKKEVKFKAYLESY